MCVIIEKISLIEQLSCDFERGIGIMMDREKMDEEIKTMNKIWREKWKTRKPERLDDFYEELKNVHKNWPNWRFGQFILNFFGWLHQTQKMDPFFPEEEEMLGYLHEFEIAMGRGNKGETSGGDV